MNLFQVGTRTWYFFQLTNKDTLLLYNFNLSNEMGVGQFKIFFINSSQENTYVTFLVNFRKLISLNVYFDN